MNMERKKAGLFMHSEGTDAFIADLRKQARELQAENNRWVEKLLDTKQQLKQPTLTAEQLTTLLAAQKTINAHLLEANYPSKITALLEQIKTLEIDLYGSSDLSRNSPFIL
jgi:paraquat-inducible protein B